MTDATLIILAKAPVPGRVKTRLCPPCSPDQAAAIARAAIVDTLAAAVATREVRPVLVLDGEPAEWVPRGMEVVPQVAGNLADRLAGAFAASTGPTALIGMDTPQVTPATLRAAIDSLLRPTVDAVLGRTLDGGWWTIGLRDPALPAFVGVPMSTRHTGDLQAARLAYLGLRTLEIGLEMDVDTFADAHTVANRIPASQFARAVFDVARDLRAPDHAPDRGGRDTPPKVTA